MRLFLLLAILTIISLQTQAQGYLPGAYIGMPFSPNMYRQVPDSSQKSKWSVSKYGGISSSFIGFKGGSATMVSAPMGLQLNRKLNNNLYAFAGIAAAPGYINFNQSFLNQNGYNKTYQANSLMISPNNFYMNARAELGLMYTNDERTFQISGSIGVERNQYLRWNNYPTLKQNNGQPFVNR